MSLHAPFHWPAEALWEAIAPDLPGLTVEVLPSVDSTNSELMRRLRGGAGVPPQTEPILLVAEQQTAGRGRLGRAWASERGASLIFSLGLPLAPQDWSGLSLAVGVSLADSLEPITSTPSSSLQSPRIGLKWPNDLWLTTPLGPRKLGGILVETAPWPDAVSSDASTQRFVVVGVGINITPVVLPADAPAPAVPPGCLQDLLPGHGAAAVDAPQTLLRVVPPLLQALQAFVQFGFAPFQSRFARRDVLADRAVQLLDGRQGTAHGVSERGALRLFTGSGLQDITSAEVSVRPAQAGSIR
jgi:BirA family biotin operon repressor/biotin-[acetyl-CoA-carboxylase] ligase